jgi:hypothetical protein
MTHGESCRQKGDGKEQQHSGTPENRTGENPDKIRDDNSRSRCPASGNLAETLVHPHSGVQDEHRCDANKNGFTSEHCFASSVRQYITLDQKKRGLNEQWKSL